MKTEEIINLAFEFGFKIKEIKLKESKIRFIRENYFIDIWNGKKGITAGIYNPNTCKMRFERNLTKGKLIDEVFDLSTSQKKIKRV